MINEMDERCGRRTLLEGGIESIEAAETQLASGALRGVMMGRAVYRSPAILADVDTRIYGEDTPELATTSTTTESTTETVYGNYQFDDGGGRSSAHSCVRSRREEALLD